MGGYRSGGHNQKLVTADASVRLDAAQIRRVGLFNPQDVRGAAWNYGMRGRHSCTVTVIGGRAPGELDVMITTPDKSNHTQHIKISTTSCTYGHERYWLHCPWCRRRVFRLFYYPNLFSNGVQVHCFACRHCLELTYDSRRTRGFYRYQAQAMRAHDRVKAWARAHGADYESDGWDAPPPRPRGMRSATYERIYRQWLAGATRADEAFIATARRLIGE